MVAPLKEVFPTVHAADVFDYGAGFPVEDYLFGFLPSLVGWTVTNPPFRLAEQFIERACASSRVGVAMIVRAAFLESVGRYKRLFAKNPPAYVLQFTERVVMHKGRLAPEGSTATAYAKSCKDPKTGKFIKCATALAPAGGKCRDTKGHFAKCGTPGAKPAK